MIQKNKIAVSIEPNETLKVSDIKPVAHLAISTGRGVLENEPGTLSMPTSTKLSPSAVQRNI